MRRTPLQCEKSLNQGKRSDGFFKLKEIKLPDFIIWSSSACEDNCDLIRIPPGDGSDLYVRLAYSDLRKLFLFPIQFFT